MQREKHSCTTGAEWQVSRQSGRTTSFIVGCRTCRPCRLLLLAAALSLLPTALLAEEASSIPDTEENPHHWKPKVRSVAVFKNGLGFFMREGEVELRDGWCLSKEIPPAAFGTLAIYSHAEDQVVDIVGAGPGEVVEFDGVDAAADDETKRTRLAACENLNLELTYEQKGTKRTAAGKVRGVEGRYVILESESNNFAVPLAAITRLQVLDLPIRVHVKGERAAPARARLGMAYLRKGVTWIPEYTLKVLDEDTAELVLRGTFVNEAEDLIHCDVSFVVGVPHFVHTDYMAPIAVGQTIRTIGTAVAPRAVQSQIMQRAAIVSNVAPRAFEVVEQPVERAAGDVAAAVGNLPQMGGAAATDYTVYTMKDLTVRRGEKAIVTLFRRKIQYSHIYRWSPPTPMHHMLVLQNATDTAWTTGPCLAVSAGQPLGEDLLKYTPKGRRRRAAGHGRDQYRPREERVRGPAEAQGALAQSQCLSRPGHAPGRSAPEKLREGGGAPGDHGVRPRQADRGDGRRRHAQADPRKLRLLERAGTARWDLKLDPGEKKKLVYTYERYVPSR